MGSKQSDSPHTPEFSTTRSFPGVGEVEALPETARARFLKVEVPGEGTPPMSPSTAGIGPPLISAGRTNTVAIIEWRSISSEEQKAHQVYVL
jgi:hypothetical protein